MRPLHQRFDLTVGSVLFCTIGIGLIWRGIPALHGERLVAVSYYEADGRVHPLVFLLAGLVFFSLSVAGFWRLWKSRKDFDW